MRRLRLPKRETVGEEGHQEREAKWREAMSEALRSVQRSIWDMPGTSFSGPVSTGVGEALAGFILFAGLQEGLEPASSGSVILIDLSSPEPGHEDAGSELTLQVAPR